MLEVRTPVLRSFGVSDPHIDNLAVTAPGDGYLQSSPEYAMKVLLAGFQQSIYQICPAFRGSEVGHLHRTEFEMLEWYRVGYSLDELMDDVEDLMSHLYESLSNHHLAVKQKPAFVRTSYRALFEKHFGFNPHSESIAHLSDQATSLGLMHLEDAEREDYLDALFSSVIEPALDEAVMVGDYPVGQAALAETRLTSEGDRVASRFELYVGGMEIANAYQELRDGQELTERFARNNERRKQLGKPAMPDDPVIIEATSKLPYCSGIALGIDRLAMAMLGKQSISEVTP